VSRTDAPPLHPDCAESAAVLASVKGTSPLPRRWPPATLDRHCARQPAKAAGRDEGMVPGRTKGWRDV